MKVICPYCGDNATLVDSKIIYGKSHGMMWLCKPCDAYVGTHKNSKRHAPMGNMANEELRRWKVNAHNAFDPIWKHRVVKKLHNRYEERKKAYSWLAKQLGIPIRHCHIGAFDLETCKRVVEICDRI